MAELAPLTPLRYDLAKLPKGLGAVVAPPYDVIDAKQRAELLARDPHNVVRLDLPEGEGDEKYANSARLLAQWRREGVLVRDAEPAFYRYDQTFLPPAGGGKAITRRGFLGLVRLVPFSQHVVLPHERTLSGPKEDRLKLTRATRTSLSPGFQLYRDPKGALDSPLETGDVLAELATPDGIHHVLAKVTAKDAMRAIVEGIARSTLLIADGHHRYETMVGYANEVSAASASNAEQPRGEHRWFLTFLVNGDDPNLVVFPTHRHVHSLGSLDFDSLLARAAATFVVEPLPNEAKAEEIRAKMTGAKRPTFAACAPDGRVSLLVLREDVDLAAHPTLGSRPEVLRRTDAAILHGGVLEPLLGITDEMQTARTNIWYPQDAAVALGALRGGTGQALFLMNATPVRQVRDVAEAGEVMPQKSTFFYPKVLTGLAIHTLDPDRLVAH